MMADRYENRSENRFINFPIIIYSMSLIFLWYEQIIHTVFTTGLEFFILRINIFFDLAKNDANKYIYPSLIYTSSLKNFVKITQALIIILIGMGILFALYSWYQKNIKRNSSSKIKIDINRNLLFMSLVPLGLLICIVFAPSIFFGYDTGRTLELINVVLSVFLIIGAYNLFNLMLFEENILFSEMKFHKKLQPQINYCKSNPYKIVSGILLFLLIPSLLLATGITYQIDGIPYSTILNSPKNSRNSDFGYAYIFDQDARALQWIEVNSYSPQIFSDEFGNKKITSQIPHQSTLYQKSLLEFSEKDLLNGYIFLTVTNEYYNFFKESNWKETKISSFKHIFNQKNKIFANGAVLYK